MPTDNGLNKHMENFMSAVRSRNASSLNCPIQTGEDVATVCQMGNIAFRTQQKLSWDNEKGKFTDKKINKQYLMKQYHNGYELPKV